MSADENEGKDDGFPEGISAGNVARISLNAISGAIPFLGGILAAAAGEWSEREQKRVNEFFRHWLQMLADEMREKEQTILEIASRLDMHDEEIAKRIEGPEYQSLLKKAFRDWAGTESEDKRAFIRNILSNAAAATFVSDDVVKLFLEWVKTYSELHFSVISVIYNNAGITRGRVWTALGRSEVREDSADADLFKLIFRDLSTGGIIRQHRETDYAGNFLPKNQQRGMQRSPSSGRTMKSAFDDQERYELTGLGDQFVHYAMTELPVKIEFRQPDEAARPEEA